MSALTIRAPGPRPGLIVAGAVAGLLWAAIALRYGAPALVLPLAAAGGIALIQRPRVAVALVVSLMVICEGRDDDLVGGVANFVYDPLPLRLTLMECLLTLAVLAVLVGRLRSDRPLRLAGPLTIPLALVTLAVVLGLVVGAFAGVSASSLMFASRQMAWLVVVPLLVINVVETERQARQALALGMGLALLKSALGLTAVLAGVGVVVDGATITYYDPVANWLVLLALLGVLAALVMRARLPLWVLAGSPLLVLSLALSFRRSFWIGALLAVALVLLLGSRPLGRRLMFLSGVLLAISIWVLSFQPFQGQSPIVERARSLQPGEVESNAQDRYRFDELRNVTAEIQRHPITGLGFAVDWKARHPLGINHENGQNYTHVVVLWWWLKLGILGLLAYVAFMGTCLVMSWQLWRRGTARWLSASGLAMLCGLIAIAVVETAGSFTGVDPRLTALLGASAGLLVVMRRLTLRQP
jgi:O-antigen ligase